MKIKIWVLSWVVLTGIFFVLGESSPLIVDISMESEGSANGLDEGQLFWQASSDLAEKFFFDEANSHRFPVPSGVHEVSLQVPADALGLRFDPRENEGFLKVDKISITNLARLPLLSWSPSDAVEAWRSLHDLEQYPEKGASAYRSTGQDPIFVLDSAAILWSKKLHILNFIYAFLLASAVVLLIFFIRKPSLRGTSLKSSLAGTAVVLILMIGMLGLGEFCFRALMRTRYDNAVATYSGYWEILKNHPEVYQFPRAWRQKTRSGDFSLQAGKFSYRLNSWGFRGEDWKLNDVKSAVPRILFLGDSYMFGWGVQDHETFPEQLRKRFAERGRPIQVLNAGIPGYSTAEEFAVLERLAPEARPSMVLLGFVMNDAKPPGAVPTPPETTYQFASSWLISEIKELLWFSVPIFSERTKFVSAETYRQDFAGPGYRVVQSRMRALRDSCEQLGIPLVVAIFPDFTQPFDEMYSFRDLHSKIVLLGRELQVPTFDLMDAFDGQNSSELKVVGDGHPNGKAFAKAAKFLDQKLLDNRAMASIF